MKPFSTLAALLLFALSISVASLGGADELHRSLTWVDGDGTVHYADAARVPKKFQGIATQVDSDLGSFSRFTPVDPVSATLTASANERRLQHLREFNAPVPEIRPAPPVPYRRGWLDDTRSIGAPVLTLGDGLLVQVRERRLVNGINKLMYVVYDENGIDRIVSRVSIGLYMEPLD